MKKILYWLRFTFSFSDTEARGFLVLTVVMAIFIAAPFLSDALVYREYTNYAADQKTLDSIMTAFEKEEKDMLQTMPKMAKGANHKYFPFDPNTASPADLVKLGLAPGVIKGIVNYRTKGGRFKLKKDFAKIYNLPAAQYQVIKEYLLLPDSFVRAKQPEKIFHKKTERTKPVFDLNEVDSLQLQLIKGIGVKLSARIIKYRFALGGYIVKDQLKEVYGLDTIVLHEMFSQTFVSPDFAPTKINVNEAPLADFYKHPYLSRKEAKIFHNYVLQHKPLKSVEDLKNIKIFSDEKIKKLEPYLLFRP